MMCNFLIDSKMRNIFSGITLCLALFAGGISAQTFKFGHIDYQQAYQAMPEKAEADKALTKLSADLQTELNKMQADLTAKSKEYLASQGTLTDAVRTAKEIEVNSMNQRVRNFPQQAQDNISKEEARLMQPIIEKLRKAIADVAKEQGLLYVFDVNSVLYRSEQSIDIIAPVKAKLGIK
jgi:outer membrane protein